MNGSAKLAPHTPRKRFAQHFLVDTQVLERLVDVIAPDPHDAMVEIGPGTGALTRLLLHHVDSLDAIELDRDLAASLGSRLDDAAGLRVHQADALRFDFSSLAAGRRLRVVGNLPYNISTPLLFHLFGHAGAMRDMHFTLQAEIVDRLAARPGSRAYGRLSVMTRLHCRAEKLFTIPPAAFDPAPRVHSAVVRLRVLERPACDIRDHALFSALVKQAFSQRRKTIRNSLKTITDGPCIREAGIDPGARPETLDIVEFAALSNHLSHRGTVF